MTNEEAIKMFKAIIMAEIYRLPHHYDAEVDDDVYDDIKRVDELLQLNKVVCEALEEQMHNCEECKHANYYDWCTLGNHLVLCREHNAMMRDDNCCRDWTPLE
jgi:hypothetical protein